MMMMEMGWGRGFGAGHVREGDGRDHHVLRVFNAGLQTWGQISE